MILMRLIFFAGAGVRSRCDSQLTNCQLLLGAGVTAEFDIRLAAAQQLTEERIKGIELQMAQGSHHTAVAALLDQYAQQVWRSYPPVFTPGVMRHWHCATVFWQCIA
jgi:hypothetical protein